MPDVFSAEGRARFSAVAASHTGPDLIPGLVALMASGDDVHVEALGCLTLGGAHVQRDSLFRIASTTKPIVAAATLALVGEGLIGIDDSVEHLLPELANRHVLRHMDGPVDETVPAVRAITVRDLLTFTFGFGTAYEMFSAAEPWPVVAAADALRLSTFGPPNPPEPPDPDTWIAALGSLPLLAQPGERWLYNTGAQVLGVLLARAARAPLDEVLRTRIFGPLGMQNTGFWTVATDRLATSYRACVTGLEVADPPTGGWSQRPAFCDGAAGLLSTADDLLAFARMLLRGGKPILSADAVAEMTRDQLTLSQKRHGGLGREFFDEQSWGFCQSIRTEGPGAGAYGWDGGLGTSWLVDPARDLTVVVLTQRMFDGPTTPALHTELQAAAYAALPSA